MHSKQRLSFERLVLNLYGQAYEDLFTEIMSYRHYHFTPIKPQGQKGDTKCDGWDPGSGTYYQCYAPEKLDADKAIKKMQETFESLKAFWHEFCEMKTFVFVINDRFKGPYPDIAKAIMDIKNANPYLDNAYVMTARMLEHELEQLTPDQIAVVVDVPELSIGERIEDKRRVMEFLKEIDPVVQKLTEPWRRVEAGTRFPHSVYEYVGKNYLDEQPDPAKFGNFLSDREDIRQQQCALRDSLIKMVEFIDGDDRNVFREGSENIFFQPPGSTQNRNKLFDEKRKAMCELIDEMVTAYNGLVSYCIDRPRTDLNLQPAAQATVCDRSSS